jgi:rubrerythrin
VTPREALELSLAAEQRAEAFYQSLAKATRDASVRALATDFAAEEQTHIETIRYALERMPGAQRGNGQAR